MADGSLLNRYWDDNDTPRPESWLDDVTTAKNNPNRPATEIYRDLRSAAASGWDFSSRWMDNPQQLGTIRTTSIVPVDLNSLMFHMEKAIARASKAAGDSAKAAQYDALANARQKALEKYLWNDKLCDPPFGAAAAGGHGNCHSRLCADWPVAGLDRRILSCAGQMH